MEFIDTSLEDEKREKEIFHLFREQFPEDAIGIKKAAFDGMVKQVEKERSGAVDLGPLFIAHRALQRTRRSAVIGFTRWLSQHPPDSPELTDNYVDLVLRAQQTVGDIAKTRLLKHQFEEVLQIEGLPEDLVETIQSSFNFDDGEQRGE